LFLPVWQKREQAIALTELSDRARESAEVSDRLRTELERRVGDYNFALERKYAFPGAIQVLDDITRILPDDTWLTQLEMHTMRAKDAQREISLRGESANAGRLVSLLEDSKLFTQTAPRSPTTKIQPGPGEIFDVSTHLKPLPPPTSLPIEMTPPARRPVPVVPRPVPAAPAANAPPAPNAATPAPNAATPAPPTNAQPAPAPVAPAGPKAAPGAAPASPAQGARTPDSLAPGHGAASHAAPAAATPAPAGVPVPASTPAPEPETPAATEGEENGG